MDLSMPAGTPATTPTQQLSERFATIYATHQATITAYLVAQVRSGDRHLAEDLASETFTRAWVSLHQVRGQDDTQLLRWLRTIARHAAIDHYRRARNTREVPTDTGHWSYTNREMEPAAGGYYTPAATGFRTAQFGGAR